MKLFALILTLIYSLQPLAADFSFSDDQAAIRMEGKIQPGDVETLLKGVALQPVRAAATIRFVVKSPGGSVTEALKIGKVINSLGYVVVVEDYCASACFFIYAAGQNRGLANSSRVGVHSVYYSDADFGQLSSGEAKERFSETEKLVRNYLDYYNTPRQIQDLIFSVSSRDVHWLSEKELQLVGNSLPYVRELTIARCGAEEDLLRSLDKLSRGSGSYNIDFSKKLNAYKNCVFSIGLNDRIAYIDRILKINNLNIEDWARYKLNPFINEEYVVN